MSDIPQVCADQDLRPNDRARWFVESLMILCCDSAIYNYGGLLKVMFSFGALFFLNFAALKFMAIADMKRFDLQR